MTWAVQQVAGVRGAAGDAHGPVTDAGRTSNGDSKASGVPGVLVTQRGNWTAYATSLARGRDVDQLCELENEFVEDHRRVLGSALPEAELWSQIGLNPEAAQRRSTIHSITKVASHP